jgi:hypothetical protein
MLYPIPDILADDRLMFSLVNLGFVLELPQVKHVTKHAVAPGAAEFPQQESMRRQQAAARRVGAQNQRSWSLAKSPQGW